MEKLGKRKGERDACIVVRIFLFCVMFLAGHVLELGTERQGWVFIPHLSLPKL